MGFLEQFRAYSYHSLSTADESQFPSGDEVSPGNQVQKQSISGCSILILLKYLVVTLVFVAGFVTARLGSAPCLSQPPWTSTIERVSVSIVPVTFVFNRTFASAPSVDGATEAAWDALVPQGQGFVRYPTSLANSSVISAVHQLHCLYSIRRAYFASVVNQTNDSLEPPHLRHCFDYLRQSLMCASDSTLEPVIPELGGASGWGIPRKCNNYEELRTFAEKWRTNNRRGFREGIFPHEP